MDNSLFWPIMNIPVIIVLKNESWKQSMKETIQQVRCQESSAEKYQCFKHKMEGLQVRENTWQLTSEGWENVLFTDECSKIFSSTL